MGGAIILSVRESAVDPLLHVATYVPGISPRLAIVCPDHVEVAEIGELEM